jgi:hypothetical protein
MQTRDITRSRWWMPAFALLIGVIMFVAFAIGGDVTGGAISLAIMAGAGALFLFGRRGETLRGIGGPERDERWEMIDLRASAFAGLVVIAVLIGSWLWELAHGDDGSPYGQVMAVGGLAYIAAIAFARWRS